jgi:uncharacterized protein YaeQ
MAHKSTIFKAQLALADIDHGHCADLALTIARHPSKTDERMMLRLAAHALHAHEVQALCGSDATLAFGAGLSDPDEPDLRLADYTGRTRLWIEVGQPDQRPLARVCSRADAVRVYALSAAAEVWWRASAGRLARVSGKRAAFFSSAAPTSTMPAIVDDAEASDERTKATS